MNATWYLDPAVWSYGLAAIAFGIFSMQLASGLRGRSRAALLFIAAVLSCAWATTAASYVLAQTSAAWLLTHVFDVLRIGALFAFVFSLAMRSSQLNAAAGRVTGGSVWIGHGLLGLLALLTLVVGLPPEDPRVEQSSGTEFAFGLLVARSVVGLVLVERLYRQTQLNWRWNIRPLCLALVGQFAYDLVLFTDALLNRQFDPNLWNARGIVSALVIPLLALAAVRNRDWQLAMSVSRSLMSGSTALFASGAYLLTVAGMGYYIRLFGGSWGRTLEIALVFAGVLVLAVVLLSATFRSKLRVFTSKHLFSYRYDYREEWLKITRALSRDGAAGGPTTCISALAELVESPAGALWLRRGNEGFVPAASHNMAIATAVESPEGSLARFLVRCRWVIDLDEFRARPGAYRDLAVPEWLAAIPSAWLVIPLSSADTLIGFVVLAKPRVRVDVNWEILDLLKTAGRQVGGYLALLQTTEALFEARKFEAFNRMSAFVVHDLKNLIAQLQLLLHNARRHQGNPDFQRDMLGTVEHVVSRMNQLMVQLRAGVTPVESPQPVALATVARKVQPLRGPVRGGIELDLDLGVCVVAHQDGLERVVGHLVQNAFDAVGDNPSVRIRVFRFEDEGVIEISDNGVGMTPEFIRERLFRPFQTTKTLGMGIGAYESMQYVRTLGGRIVVDSEPGRGTSVSVCLPLVVERQLKMVQEESA